MEDNEENLLDNLLLAAIETDEIDKEIILPKQTKPKTATIVNEDELFLSKIARNDLKVLQQPCTSNVKIKENKVIPKTKSVTSNFKNGSTVHSGDTDSSDDEEKRDFENRRYNDYGNEIKHLLSNTKANSEGFSTSKTWKTKHSVPNKRPDFVKPIQEKLSEDILTDPFFGIRISKPLISSATLEDRMSGRKAVSMARIKNFVNLKLIEDWVVAGVIVDKSPVKTSQNGNNYIIFTLSDLKAELRSISLFLFRSAYKELWKTTIGTVLGVLNPSVLENRDGSKQEATLSVDNHQKVMIFGQSKDFGYCKSLRKDGKQCTSFVNTNNCVYCIYHVRQAYQQCARRSELQAKFAGGGLTALRNKVLGKNEVFYAGKSYMAIPAKANKKLLEKDSKILQALKKSGTVTLPRSVKKSEPKMQKGIATSLDISRAQRLKDLELLKKLNGSSDITDKTDLDPTTISSGISLDESKKTAIDIISKLKNSTRNKQTISLEDKTEFDPKSVSSGISLDESRKSALDVISKLKNSNNKLQKNSLPDKTIVNSISPSEISLSDSEMTVSKRKNGSNTAESRDQSEFDPKSVSSGISIDESRKSALDVISKLKNSNNKLEKNFLPDKTTVNSMSSSEISLSDSEMTASKRKNGSNTAESRDQSEFDPKSVSSGISLDESRKSALDVISKLKNSNNKLEKNSLPDKTTVDSISPIEISLSDSEVTASKRKNGGDSDVSGDQSEFDPKSISSGISLDESRISALDVISKLKNSGNKLQKNSEDKTKVDSTSVSSLFSSKDSKVIASKCKNANDSSESEDQSEVDSNSISNSESVSLADETISSQSKFSDKSKSISDRLKTLNFVPKLSNPNRSQDEIDLEICFGDTERTEKKSSQSANLQKQKKNSSLKKNEIQKSTKPKSSNNNLTVQMHSGNESKLLENIQERHTSSSSNANCTKINLTQPLSKRSIDVAKQKALNWVQKNGPISKNNRTGTKKSGVKRFLNESEDNESKKLKLDKNVVFSDRFKKIMALTSKHADLLENYDLEQQEQYFNKLEAKEKMEEKMMSTFKVDCKAVKCLTCKYTSFSAADRCKEERHVLKVFNAVKRFFKCGDCGNRTVSLEIVPLLSCKNCNSSKWERTTMMKEKKVHIGEALSIRGGEQKFLNSHVADANVNLLVPEDEA